LPSQLVGYAEAERNHFITDFHGSTHGFARKVGATIFMLGAAHTAARLIFWRCAHSLRRRDTRTGRENRGAEAFMPRLASMNGILPARGRRTEELPARSAQKSWGHDGRKRPGRPHSDSVRIRDEMISRDRDGPYDLTKLPRKEPARRPWTGHPGLAESRRPKSCATKPTPVTPSPSYPPPQLPAHHTSHT
jgi:hypothetical protein